MHDGRLTQGHSSNMNKVISTVLLLTTTCALGQTTNVTNMTSRTVSTEFSAETMTSGMETTTPQRIEFGTTSTPQPSLRSMSATDPCNVDFTTDSPNDLKAQIEALTVGISVLGGVTFLLLVCVCVVTILYRRNKRPCWTRKPKTTNVLCSIDDVDTYDGIYGNCNVIARERTSEYGSDAAGKERMHLRVTKSMSREDKGGDNASLTDRRRTGPGNVIKNTGSTSFSVILGENSVDVFSDISDTNEILNLCQGHFDDLNQEPVRESIIEKVIYIPLGLRGVINEAFDEEEIYDDQQIPSSYCKADLLTSRQRISEEAIPDVLYTVENETLQTNPAEESAQSEAVAEPFDMSASNSRPHAADFNRGMVIKKTIGPSGGCIKLLGVALDIPSGALSSNKEICVGILWHKEVLPKLSKKQTLLSPVVVCEPHALRFDKPVTLTLPHCAQDVLLNWDITLLKSETTANQVTNWKPLTLEDYDERSFHDSHVIVKLYHFTLYALVGQSKEKACASKCVNLVAFAPPLQQRKFFKIRLYCTNYYTELKEEEQELEKVRCGEREIGGNRLNATSRLIIRDSGSNLCSSLESLSPGWTTNSNQLEIDFETAWHGYLPSCEFILKPDGLRDEIACDLKTFQLDRPEKASIISVAEQTKHNLFGERHLTTFPYELCRFLMVHLDVSNPLHRDWRAVAEHLRMDTALVTWVEQRQQSPTMFILQEWEKQRRSLESFYEFMKNLDRQDVASEVMKYLASGQ